MTMTMYILYPILLIFSIYIVFYLPVNNSGKHQLDSRAQRPVLGDRTNGVVNGCVGKSLIRMLLVLRISNVHLKKNTPP